MAKVFELNQVYYTSPKPADEKLFSVLSIGHYTAFPGFNLDRSGGHRVEHLIYTIDGEALGDIAGERSFAKAGSIWLMPKDKPYRYWCDAAGAHWEGRWTEYDGAWARPLWTMMGLNGVTHIPRCFEAQPIIEELHARLHADGNRALQESNALLWKLFAILERALANRGDADGPPHPISSPTGILLAQQYAIEHLDESVTLDDLAKAANLSPFHFARTFRKKTGFTPAAYVRAVRMNRARELLRRGDLSIKQVGRAVGYPQPHHFSAVFKQATGFSPREFVRSNQG